MNIFYTLQEYKRKMEEKCRKVASGYYKEKEGEDTKPSPNK